LLGDEQRDERAAEPEERREPQQIRQVQTVLGEDPVHPEQARDDRKQQHHREVGGDQQEDAFHEQTPCRRTSGKMGPMSGNSTAANCSLSQKRKAGGPAFLFLRGRGGRKPRSFFGSVLPLLSFFGFLLSV